MLAALDLFGGDWRKRHALGGDLVLEVRHDLASFLVAAHEGEPTRRLDQVEEAQHHHDCTEDAAENEHLAPAGDRQDDEVHHRSEERTAVGDEADVGLVLAALLWRRELGQRRIARRERGTKADAHEETASGEEVRVGRGGCHEAEYGEEAAADENRLATSDTVGDGAGQQAADQVSDHRNGVEESELFKRHEALILQDHADGSADTHIDRVAEREAGKQPHNLFVEAGDRDAVKTRCDSVERSVRIS